MRKKRESVGKMYFDKLLLEYYKKALIEKICIHYT